MAQILSSLGTIISAILITVGVDCQRYLLRLKPPSIPDLKTPLPPNISLTTDLSTAARGITSAQHHQLTNYSAGLATARHLNYITVYKALIDS